MNSGVLVYRLETPYRNTEHSSNNNYISYISLEFQFKEPSSPSEILKAVHGIGMDIFLNLPFAGKNVISLLWHGTFA